MLARFSPAELQRYARLLVDILRQFIANGGVLNAAALTYTTLFAVVPLMTVSYAVLALVPAFQDVGTQVQGWIFANFVPATGEVVQQYLASFADHARKLTAVGGIFLIVTSIMMLKNIEAALNRIWRVAESRRGMSSFLLYWAILSLGPILIGLGLFISSYLASVELISDAAELVGKSRLLSLLPLLLSVAAFTLIYAAVPNCPVPFRNAAIAGVVVALLFEAAKRLFAWFVAQFPTYELVYGAFAAVPLFLVWIFVSWFLILMGAELSRALTVYNRNSGTTQQSHQHLVLAILHQLWIAQLRGEGLTDQQLLRQVAGLDQDRWDQYQLILTNGKVICHSREGDTRLCRDLSQFSLYQLQQLLPWPLPAPSGQCKSDWSQQFDGHLAELAKQQQTQLAMPLAQLFDTN